MTHAKTDCQGEDPIMILIERLRPVGDPINASEALRLEAAEALQTQAWALDMQGEELSNRIEDHKVKDATIASLQGEVERLKEALSTIAKQQIGDEIEWPEDADFVSGYERCVECARAALSQHPGEGEKA